MTQRKNQQHLDPVYQAAMEIIDQEWLDAGKTRDELHQENRLAKLYNKLLADGLSPSEIHTDWAGQTISAILARVDNMDPRDYSILLAEGEDATRSAWEKAFNRMQPYKRVKFVRNGQEVVDEVMSQTTDYDLIVLDVNMPVMDGRTTLLKLREYAPNIKVVFLTGTLGRVEAERLQAETGIPVILKEASVKNFVDIVDIIDCYIKQQPVDLQEYVRQEALLF